MKRYGYHRTSTRELCGKPGIHKHIISFYSGSEHIPDKLDGSIRFMHHT